MSNYRFISYISSLVSLALVSLLPSACTKNPVREKIIDNDTTKAATYENGIFIVNEGNFNWANASVTFIENQANTVVQNIFSKSNNRSLGDVAESMSICAGKGYIVMNNSNRIEVVSLKDFKSAGTITGLNSPRYLQIIDSTKAYATNLQNCISILDLKTNTVSGTIQTSGWTENLIRYDKYVLVTSVGRFSETSAKRNPQLLVIDTEKDMIVDSIKSGKDPVGLVIDKKQKVWILCSGGYDHSEPPSLMRVNPELRVVEKVFVFSDNTSVPGRLCMNPSGDTMYFLKGGVYQMPVTATTLPSQPLIQSEGRLLYGLDIHPRTGRIYVTDAKDYVQNGSAYQYTVSGTLVREYTAGRIPGSFCFTQNINK